MGLFKKDFKSSNIKSINDITKIGIKDTIDGTPSYYALQRLATTFKLNKEMDLAIACLKHSNELSDMYDRPPLLEKDYLRLVKFLQQNKQYEAAEVEFNNICKRHPQFADKRISNLVRINEQLNKAKILKCDTAFLTTNSTCPICSKYNNQRFSIKGKKYPKIPSEIVKNGGFDKDCIISLTIDIEDSLN